jgi:hypothetical protein
MQLPESLVLALMLIALLMALSIVDSVVDVARDAHLEKSRRFLDRIHLALWETNSIYRQRVETLLSLLRDASAHACKVRGSDSRGGRGRIYISLSIFDFKARGNRVLYKRIY